MKWALLLVCLVKSAELYNYQNLQHYSTVQIGGQPIKVMFDTGSNHVWVASKSCKSLGCKKQTTFDPSLSFNLQTSFEVEFGSGRVRGELILDTIQIDQIELKNVTIGLVTHEFGNSFSRLPFAGIIGLGPAYIAHWPTFFMELQSQKSISTASISLAKNESKPGRVSFGGKPHANYYKVISKDYWEIQLKDILVNGVSAGICQEIEAIQGSCQAVVDSGTSVLGAPYELVNYLNKVIGINPDCSNAQLLPSLGFKIGKDTYQLDVYDYVTVSEGRCSLALMEIDFPAIVLGATFIRKFNLVLDYETKLIGLINNYKK